MVRITFWIIIEPLLHVLYVGLEISYSSENRVLLKSWCSRFEIFDVFEKLKNPKKIALSCMFSAIVLIQIGQFCCPSTKKKSLGLCAVNFEPQTYHIAHLNGMPWRFQGYPWCWPGVNNLASSSFQSDDIPKVVQNFGSFWGCFFDENDFPGQTVDIRLFYHACL